MNPESYQAFMQPRGVAIVRASDNEMKTSGRTLRYLGRYGYGGRLPSTPAVSSCRAVLHTRRPKPSDAGSTLQSS